MENTAYIRPLIRWWRLIVSLTIVAVVASAISAFLQPDVYVSKTTLVVGSPTSNPNPDSGQIYMAQTLAIFYADLAQREPIQNATQNALGVNWLPKYQAIAIDNTQLVEISVTDTNPKRAQIVAEELARQLINQTYANNNSTDATGGVRQEFINQQLAILQAQIQETEKKLEELQASLQGLNSANQIANIQLEIQNQSDRLNSYRQNYASFLSNSQQRALNTLSVVDPANFPKKSAGTSKILIILLAGVVGASLGIGTAYFLEFLDRTIKTTSDVERVFNLPVIGYINEIQENEDKSTYVLKNPNSILAENFRLLRSNIEFFQISNPTKTILITSPSQGNGKTTVASNLALSISQEEQKVLLVDADLRRPAIHQALNLAKAPGLSELIRNKVDVDNVVRDLDDYLQVITAGDVPSNVTQVAGSRRISSILGQFKEKFDLIIIDAPPLIISDSYDLASKADGVILILEMGQTTEDQARTIKEQLDRANARLLGVVFNKISEDSPHSYFDFQYRSLSSSKYYGDYVSHDVGDVKTSSRSKKLMAFFERGEVPPEVVEEVEHAITAIKTQPRELVNRMRKPKKKSKSS